MELAAAALSSVASAIGSVFSGATAAGTAATAAGWGANIAAGTGAAATGFGLSSGLTGILQGAASVVGILGAVGAGEEKATAYELAANDALTEVDSERLKGIERRTSLRRSLLASFGERDVAYAASGVDLSFGTPALARTEAEKDAERAFTVDQGTEDFRVTRLQERAANLRAQASGARSSGFLKALGIGLDTGFSIARRG